MKTFYKIIILFMITFLLIRCAKDRITPRDYPRLITQGVTNINDTGAVFHAKIIYRGNFDVLDYGFVWTTKQKVPTIDKSDRVVYSENIQASEFSSNISSALEKGKRYIVRAFVQTKEYLVYGDTLSFVSLGSKAPIINSFSPKTGTWGDTISVYGSHFSLVSGTDTVKLGSVVCKTLSASDSVLTIQIAEARTADSVKMTISLTGNRTTSSGYFHYLIPKIISVEPLTGNLGDTLTIHGENFAKKSAFNAVWLGQDSAKIVSTSSTVLKVLVPDYIATGTSVIKVNAGGFDVYYSRPFKMNPPVIETVSPLKITQPKETITITGDNFPTLKAGVKVNIGGFDAVITAATAHELQVTLPYGLIPNYYVSVFKKDLSITVSGFDSTATGDSTLRIHWQSTWTRLADFPGPPSEYGIAFSINGKGYYGAGRAYPSNIFYNDFWEYDPETDQWTKRESLPGKPRMGASAFVLNDEGYVGLGSGDFNPYYPQVATSFFKDFYKYDPATGHWTAVAEFPGLGRVCATAFAVNNLGYVATGYYGMAGFDPNAQPYADDTWQYDPVSNQWTQIANFPIKSWYAVGCTIGNVGYVYANQNIYTFSNGTWTQLIYQPNGQPGMIGFSLGTKFYFGLGEVAQYFFEFDPENQTFANMSPLDVENDQIWMGASTFVINNKAYVVGGWALRSASHPTRTNEVWVFDPTKPE